MQHPKKLPSIDCFRSVHGLHRRKLSDPKLLADISSSSRVRTAAESSQVSIFRRLVILKFVNLALTVLITNSEAFLDLLGMSATYQEDFTPDW